jgi:hypothetical protein
VFTGAKILFFTKKIYALYEVDISASTIDINVFQMIYNTAVGSCKRRQLYCSQLVYFTSRNPHRFIMLYKVFDRSKDDNTLIKSPSISTPDSPITDVT